jgi:hypothetical protein
MRGAVASVQPTELVSQKEAGGKFRQQPLAARQAPQSRSELEHVIGSKKRVAFADAGAASFDPLDLSATGKKCRKRLDCGFDSG